MKVLRKQEIDTANIQVGDQMVIPLAELGEFTATVHKVIVIASSFFMSEFHSEGEDVAAISKAIVVEKTEPVITVSQEESIPIAVEETEELTTEAIPEMSREDVELIALVTMAEAEGECEEGKRLVIDTVLNRMDSEYFPDTVYEVIYQPNQFSSMWNGRVDRCEVREDICELVYEELESRTNYDVVFFTAGEYSAYGVPMFQVGNHYFSKYE